MADFKGLAHIGIFTSDIEISKKFYTENLGFKFERETMLDKPDNQWLKIAFLNLNGMVLELLEPSNKANIKKGNNGCVDHLAIEVKGLDEIVSGLKSKGMVFETQSPVNIEKLFNGVKNIFFSGPGGERLELFEYLD